MKTQTSAAEYVPSAGGLPVLREAVQDCRGCDLYLHASHAVFGEGPRSASVVFIGEQPGDEEDRQGRPFVGPAGRLLDRALKEVGIDRSSTYVTNAVKHFKFEERGKRRLHKKPSGSEVKACRPWLEAELARIKPSVIVCLGATAAQTMFGASFRLTQHRGEVIPQKWAPKAMATVHPSAILRTPDDKQRHLEYDAFVADLAKVKEELASISA